MIWLFSYIALQIKISIVLYFTLKTKQYCVVVTLEEDFSIVYFAIISTAEDLKWLFIKFCPSKHALLTLSMNRKLDIFKQYILQGFH